MIAKGDIRKLHPAADRVALKLSSTDNPLEAPRMTGKTAAGPLVPLALLLFGLPGPASGQAPTRLWVLAAPDEIVEYDPSTFSPQDTVQVPPEALDHPEWLSVSTGGRILFDPDPSRIAYPGPGSTTARVWLWNGKEAELLRRGWTRTETPEGENVSVLETAPRCILSAQGAELYWLGNEFRRLEREGYGIQLSVTSTFRAWRAGPAGEPRDLIGEIPFPPCECGTGVCEETCPEGEFWAPPGGVLDFFFVTQWIPGQLGSTYLATYLFRRQEEGWQVQELPRTLERVLDADGAGTVVVHTVEDGACCGWDNESSDLTFVTSDEGTDILFDEWARYGNTDYDVSFFTSNASLSPDARLVAVTIVATANTDQDIRLSSQGQEDPVELERVRQAIKELPAVEVMSVTGTGEAVLRVPRATLIGWLSDTEILVLEDQVLVALDTASGSRRPSSIHVPQSAHVFLR